MTKRREKQKTTKPLRLLLLVVGMLFCGLPLHAEHIIGGLFTYQCVGFLNNDPTTGVKVYRMILRVYRDCQGGGSDFDSTGDPAPTATVTIYRDDVIAPFDTKALLAPVVRSVNPDPGNPCLEVPDFVCVEEGVYEFELELPVSAENYHIVYQRCCRNATINNLISPDDVGATFAITITPEAQQLCNEAPDFVNLPPVVFCVDNAFSFDLSASDADGDSLVYRLCSPWDGGGRNVTPITDPNGLAPDPDLPPPFAFVPFIEPEYTATRPLGQSAQFDLDPLTGMLTGLTSLQGQFVVGICVEEYRDGQLISEVRRDIQINTTLCDQALTAAVESQGMAPDGTFLIENCGLEDFVLTNLSQKESLIEAYRWVINLDTGVYIGTERDLRLSFPNAGTFSGQLILNPVAQATCRDTADLLFSIFPAVEATASVNFDPCRYDPLQFSSTVLAPGGGASLFWNFGDGQSSTLGDPMHLYDTAGDYQVIFSVQDQNRCADTVSLDISFFPVPDPPILETIEGCSPVTFVLPPAPSWFTNAYDILWDFGNGQSSTTWSGSVTYGTPGTYDLSLQVLSPSGCDLDSGYPGLIEVSESPVAAFTFSPNPPDFLDPTVTFRDQSVNAADWLWNFGGAGLSREPNPLFTFPDTGSYQVVLQVSSINGCRDTAVQILDILAQNTYFLPNAFTPNGDLLNDVFVGKGILTGVQNFEFSVWNRWGEAVFSTSDPDSGWNGRLNNSGNLQPQGVYVYLVKFVDINGIQTTKTGEVLLLP